MRYELRFLILSVHEFQSNDILMSLLLPNTNLCHLIIIIIIIIIITCTLIDVAIPADRNVVQKEAEKKLKYKGLYICRYKECGT